MDKIKKKKVIQELNVPLTTKVLVRNGVIIEDLDEKELEDNTEILLDDYEELNEVDLEQDLSEEEQMFLSI
ncbi:unnamed protein product [Rhizophagus irregularis]|nr:unnamed protein product [Rhizophagus irregularis]